MGTWPTASVQSEQRVLRGVVAAIAGLLGTGIGSFFQTGLEVLYLRPEVIVSNFPSVGVTIVKDSVANFVTMQ